MDSKCTWLIEAPSQQSSIRLHLKEFATECGWDHLYIFDGDSVFSDLVGVLSGMILCNFAKFCTILQCVVLFCSILNGFALFQGFSWSERDAQNIVVVVVFKVLYAGESYFLNTRLVN